MNEGRVENRTRYLQLLDDYGITQAKSAELVAAVTGRPRTLRLIRSNHPPGI